MFITEDDYKVVIGDTAMKVVSQASAENRANAEREAQEEISGYLRPKYDCDVVFATEGEKRNHQSQYNGITPYQARRRKHPLILFQ